MRFRDLALSDSSEDRHEALVLVEQLSAVVDSRYRAELEGGQQFRGWGEDRQILARMSDSIFAIAAGLGGISITAADFWPRPERESKVGTIADFNVGSFMRELSS